MRLETEEGEGVAATGSGVGSSGGGGGKGSGVGSGVGMCGSVEAGQETTVRNADAVMVRGNAVFSLLLWS